ncbi:MAG: hypothetical protein RRC34_12660 [Lentisphaeria bacterium]|nr:hypothetical protein [Lentisphaeria bacterium]
MIKPNAAAGGFVRLAALLIVASAVASLAQTPPPPKPTPATTKKIIPLKPGYSLPDSARDPFFLKKDPDSGSGKQGVSPEKLAASLKISGLMGKPEQPEKAGLLIGTRIYHVNDAIPVMLDGTVYSLVLERVKFPGEVFLRYKDQTTVLEITPKN